MQRHHREIITSRPQGRGVLTQFNIDMNEDRIRRDLVAADEQRVAAVERMAHLARIEALEARIAELERERDQMEDADYRRRQNEEQRLYEQSQEFEDRMENNHYF